MPMMMNNNMNNTEEHNKAISKAQIGRIPSEKQCNGLKLVQKKKKEDYSFFSFLIF